jgi:hypothetical protein
VSVNETKGSKSMKSAANSKSGKKLTKEVDETAFLEMSALTDVAEYIDEQLWLIGNRTLLSLNLSRNDLTDASVNKFLLALQYQKTIMDMHRSQATGLLRLIINVKFDFFLC